MSADPSRSAGAGSGDKPGPRGSGAPGGSLSAKWAPRFYRPTDDAAIVNVLTSAFDGWPKVAVSVPAADHLRWKLDNHPHARNQSLVAEVDGQIVGW